MKKEYFVYKINGKNLMWYVMEHYQNKNILHYKDGYKRTLVKSGLTYDEAIYFKNVLDKLM